MGAFLRGVWVTALIFSGVILCDSLRCWEATKKFDESEDRYNGDGPYKIECSTQCIAAVNQVPGKIPFEYYWQCQFERPKMGVGKCRKVYFPMDLDNGSPEAFDQLQCSCNTDLCNDCKDLNECASKFDLEFYNNSHIITSTATEKTTSTAITVTTEYDPWGTTNLGRKHSLSRILSIIIIISQSLINF